MFFVEVNQSEEVRRNILESLKDIVENLQRFEKFKSIREEKFKSIVKLRADIKELSRLDSSLKAVLPTTKLRINLERKSVNKKSRRAPMRTKKEVSEIETESPKPETELEKLGAELNAIESRLSSLK